MGKLYRKPLFGALALGLAGSLLAPATLAGATDDGATLGAPDPTERTYLVTVENLTEGQPFTPPVAATHNRRSDVFTVGEVASPGIRAVAENGDVPSLVGELEAMNRVGDVVVGDADGPVLPGASTSFEITSVRGERRISLASMLICTNDGFTGLDSIRLPSARGASTEYLLNGYDAGSEINTEDFDDIVPPCGPLTGVESGGAGTGASNPALAENGKISHHPGIGGSVDLDTDVHGFESPVARVTIQRIDGAAQYSVQVVNATAGQPFTPPAVITHNRQFDLFTVGDAASPAIQGLAENGDVPGVVGAADGARGVRSVNVADGPVRGGEDTTITFYTRPGVRRVSLASMLICTNDGFTGLDRAQLPRWAGETAWYGLNAYDAGTELNTEDFDDIVPPCGPLTGVDSNGAGTGASNPQLAEGGVIAMHRGVVGDADLLVDVHGFGSSVGEVIITRIS